MQIPLSLLKTSTCHVKAIWAKRIHPVYAKKRPKRQRESVLKGGRGACKMMGKQTSKSEINPYKWKVHIWLCCLSENPI